MAEQLTFFTTLGGTTVTVPKRGKHYVKPNGYAHMPGTGPAGETCGTCEYIRRSRRWAKCQLAYRKHTGGRGSDILVGSPACKMWEPAVPNILARPAPRFTQSPPWFTRPATAMASSAGTLIYSAAPMAAALKKNRR